ncbi:hypothetical protein [Anabaena sp. PCC 7108]|uniref:hypothetical protein n=1 Tax=Anabaena sp. PCC 7108 TaxID=163908 RepID=UPI000347D3BB|nr:hypothetical protein [Anabaena sp. PCC 7108]
MDAQLATQEIREMQELMQDYAPAQEAMDKLIIHNGNLETTFEDLWIEKNGHSRTIVENKSLWQVTLKVLRRELCGDEGFSSQIKEYSKNPGSAPLLTGLIVSLVGLAGLPIDPAIATVVVLYILKIGLNIFCEYTEPPANSAGTLSPVK